MMNMMRINIARSFAILVLVLVAGLTMAQNNITNMWNQAGGTHNWTDSGNWTNTAAYPDGANALAILTNNITSSQTINLNQAISLGNLWVGDPNGDAAFTIAAGTGGRLAVATPGVGSCAINKYGTNTDVVAVAVTNVAGINRSTYVRALTSGGTLVFSNAVYGGAGSLRTDGNVGTINFAGTGNSLGDQGFFSIGSGIVLLTGSGIANSLSVPGSLAVRNGVFTNNMATYIGQYNVAGTLTVDGGSFLSRQGTRVGCNSATERSGLGSLIVTNGGVCTSTGGVFRLYGSNTASYVATVTLAGGAGGPGVLDLSTNITAFLTTADATNNYINFNGGKLRYSNTIVDQQNFIASNIVVTVMEGGAQIEVSTAGRVVTIANALRHAGAAATDGGLTKSCAGTLVLSGTNTYTGATIVSNGVLRTTHAQCLSTNTDLYLFTSAGELNLNFNGTNIVRSLTIDGTRRGTGIYGASRILQITGDGCLQTTWPPLKEGVILIW